MAGYLANLAGCVNFLVKAILGVTVMMWVRWTLPRLRIDQVMTTCLKYCVPLAAVCFLGVLAWQVLGLPSLEPLVARMPGSGVREPWVGTSEPTAKPEVRASRRACVSRTTGRLAIRRIEQAPSPRTIRRRLSMLCGKHRREAGHDAVGVDRLVLVLLHVVCDARLRVCAGACLFTSNIVRMAFYLMLSLGAIAGLFFLAGAEFVGAMQLMIYVGGTLVLLVFGVMLTAQARFITMRTTEWRVGIVPGRGQRAAVLCC